MKKIVSAALALGCSVVLAACGVEKGSYEPPEDKFGDSSEVSQGKDPRSFTGLTEVGEFDEIEPIVDDPKPQLPVEMTDSAGNDVVIKDTSRIIALDMQGTFTKTLTGLGMADNIVGRATSSTGEDIDDKPVVTQGGHNINVEAVLKLKPSLLIVDPTVGPKEAIEQIRDAGVTTVVVEPNRTIDSVGDDIITLADVVGLPDEGRKLAVEAVSDLEIALAESEAMAPEKPLRMAFLYARGDGGTFFIMGKGTGAKEIIEGAGGVDVAAENDLGYAEPANAESLARLNPDVFVMLDKGLESVGGLDGLLSRPGVKQTKAGMNERVISLPEGQSLAFGPQTAEVIQSLAKAVYTPGQ